MTAREIADLFFQLELTLIASLKRNLARHKAWEKEEGFDWEAWQSAKLRDIRRFQKENRKEVEKFAPVIDKETRQLIEEQYQEGGTDGFFSMNDRRVNALLDEMQTAQQHVEKAALRYMDDIYRKTVRTAALGMATGSMTLQQATDATTKEFLAAGINCVQYKNGRRVNIASYAEMALRTAATRATLMGEAKLRESMGIDTVLVSQYGACSETCLPWQGLVYIDDVWQDYNGPHTPGGTYGISRNGHQYPLLSVAVKNGLFHPNCRHTLTTWFEGISTRPKPMDKAQIERVSKLEKKQRAMERDVRALKRLAAGTQDADQAASYRKEVRAAQKKLKAFVDENGDGLRRDYWRERYDGVPLQEKQEFSLDTLHVIPQPITMESIQRVRTITCDTLNEDASHRLKTECKQLLMFARKQSESVETGRLYDLNMNPLTERLTGEATGNRIRLPDLHKPYVALHTHPDCAILSHGDLLTFTKRDNARMIIALGHDGHCYAAEKTDNYDGISALSVAVEIAQSVNMVTKGALTAEQYLQKVIEEIQIGEKKMEQYGVKFYEW